MADGAYIYIHPKTFEVRLKKPRSGNWFSVPTLPSKDRSYTGQLAALRSVVFYKAIHPICREEHLKRTGRDVKFSLPEPDGWLLTLAYVMWQGVLQGLSWDACKVAVQHVLAQLRKLGVAPPARQQKSKEEAATVAGRQLEFRYESWSKVGQLRRLYIKLESVHESPPPNSRRATKKKKLRVDARPARQSTALSKAVKKGRKKTVKKRAMGSQKDAKRPKGNTKSASKRRKKTKRE